jgi:hypothetical protein
MTVAQPGYGDHKAGAVVRIAERTRVLCRRWRSIRAARGPTRGVRRTSSAMAGGVHNRIQDLLHGAGVWEHGGEFWWVRLSCIAPRPTVDALGVRRLSDHEAEDGFGIEPPRARVETSRHIMLPFTTEDMHLVHWGVPGPLSQRGAVDSHLTSAGKGRQAGEKRHRRDAQTYNAHDTRRHGGSPSSERIESSHDEGVLRGRPMMKGR